MFGFGVKAAPEFPARFFEKTQATPWREIELALKRMAESER